MNRKLPQKPTGPKYSEDGERLAVIPNKHGQIEVLPTENTQEILRMGIRALESSKGRPAVYPDSDEGLDLFMEKTVEYLRHIEEVNANPDMDRKLMPDVESWCFSLQITRCTLSHYRKRGKKWQDAIDGAKTIFLAYRKQAATDFRMPPLVLIFDAVNNYQYANTSQIKIEQTEAPQDRHLSLTDIQEELGLLEGPADE